jgi:aspartyl-tRNA(Asn)/glutamyl-tRNA(Gln) amidotransferase subunit A
MVRAAAASLGVCEDVSYGRLMLARPAWRILLAGETCNNLSRYDGVKFGFRAEGYKNIDELYTMSRTQAFTLLTKMTILYGSDVLSKGRYDTCYDRSLRVRRVLRNAADELFGKYDVLAMPGCSKTAYTAEELGDSIDAVYAESLFTAFASILGLPAVTVGGIQLVADSMNDELLLSAAAALERR